MTTQTTWDEMLAHIQKNCSKAEFHNWFSPLAFIETESGEQIVEVPNIFARSYLIDNYSPIFAEFFPSSKEGNYSFKFVIKEADIPKKTTPSPTHEEKPKEPHFKCRLNKSYTFENFIDGASNQFIKSAAMGVANNPGKSYNPLFIHGSVGLGKTHLLHAIGHYIKQRNKKLKVHCITTEGFINDLVFHLKNKNVEKMKAFYRSLDVLLVDDIQFLQNRLNFEEELINTFETLILNDKQVVTTSDKPPSELKLSARMIGRMEWGLVARIEMPDLETRAAILQHKAEKRGFALPSKVAFSIADNIFSNVRQLEGAVNRLSAYCKLMHLDVTIDVAEQTLGPIFQVEKANDVSIEKILKSVSSLYDVPVKEICGTSRSKEIALPRQVAMYLAKELLTDSLKKIAKSFGGKTHSTLLHAWKKIGTLIKEDVNLRRQVQKTKQELKR